eukprot:TRINITY_DN8477_c0_g1_i1.p1 TRINITY_DN8477_c0_g1~~TRINITY_DN8477_c0_g1_i1.p1  ORF type:complete len:347 (-),score=87.59 TRINITY_DN8477_c0_g1_i1:4-1044(-)
MMRAVLVDGATTNVSVGEVPRPELAPNEVLIAVAASAVNRADLLQRRGAYPPPPGASTVLGLEVSGRIAAVGSACTGRWEIDEPVMALLAGGGYAELAAVDEGSVMKVPRFSRIVGAGAAEVSAEPLVAAAAVPEAFLTAFQALVWHANLQPGEKVLVHAGASGVGLAAIQIARVLGAVPFATCSASKTSACEAHGAAAAFDRTQPWASAVAAHPLSGGGVDVILDFVAGPYWAQNTQVAKLDARIVMLGTMGGGAVPAAEGMDVGVVLRKRLTIKGSTLRNRSLDYKRKLVASFAAFAAPKFAAGSLAPVVDTVFSLDQVSGAHDAVAADRNIGKVVLRVARTSS